MEPVSYVTLALHGLSMDDTGAHYKDAKLSAQKERLRARVSGLQRSQQESVRAQRLLLHLKMHKSKHANTFIEHRIYFCFHK